MKALIKNLKNILRPLKRQLENYLPRNMNINSATAQVYLGGDFETRYTLTNFPSLFSPSTAYKCIYDIALYNELGYCIGRNSINIAPFGSAEIIPSEVFGKNLPNLGIFTAKIRSSSRFVLSDRHLGKITSQIYALYSDKKINSLALVHPQTSLVKNHSNPTQWKSDVLLDSGKIEKLIAIQINPTNKCSESTLYLCKDNGYQQKIGEVSSKISPLGVIKVEWDIKKIGIKNGYFSIAANKLTSPNAKPIILAYFKNGSFSGMHA